jgi:predicted amino acid dehydrogenase
MSEQGWEKTQEDAVKVVEKVAEELSEPSRHLLQAFVSILGAVGGVHPREARLLFRTMKVVVMLSPEDETDEQ